MVGWIRRALTKRVKKGKSKIVLVQPDEKLVYAVKFVLGTFVCLSGLEVAHMAFLGSWNSEIFAGITGLAGTVTGILVAQKA